MKNKYRLALFICLILMLASCDTFHGCGPIVAVCAPEPVVTYKYYNGYKYTYYTGKYYYPVLVLAENGRRYKVYTSYDKWNKAHCEDGVIVCVE